MYKFVEFALWNMSFFLLPPCHNNFSTLNFNFLNMHHYWSQQPLELDQFQFLGNFLSITNFLEYILTSSMPNLQKSYLMLNIILV